MEWWQINIYNFTWHSWEAGWWLIPTRKWHKRVLYFYHRMDIKIIFLICTTLFTTRHSKGQRDWDHVSIYPFLFCWLLRTDSTFRPTFMLVFTLTYFCSVGMAQMVKSLLAMLENQVQSLGREDPLEKEMAIHSNILVWRIPRTEASGRLQSMWSQKGGHNWVTNTFVTIICSNSVHLSKLFQTDFGI